MAAARLFPVVAAALIDAIAGERITQLFGLPLMYAALLHHPLRAQRDLSSLRLCLYAMAPMAKLSLSAHPWRSKIGHNGTRLRFSRGFSPFGQGCGCATTTPP